ncbi:hypothetical protein ACFLTE_01575 [Bacteroidota bacterium]
MNNFFDIKRFLHLIKRQFILNNKSIYITLASASAVMFVLFLLIAISSKDCMYVEQINLFYTIFYIGGYILSSKIFNELSDYRTGYIYLTLPASNFEKLISGWLFSSFVYSIIGLISVIIISTLANALASLIMGFDFFAFNYEFKYLILASGVYIVTQSVFILGSASFKKHAFLKTLLSLFIIGMAISIIAGFLTWGIIGEFKIDHTSIETQNLPPGLSYFFEEQFPIIVKIVFWYLAAPFILLISYFKLKESEV